MFSKLALYVVASMAVFAAAHSNTAARRGYQSCNGGSVQCCNSMMDSSPSTKNFIKALLHLDIPDATGQIGLTCSPVTAIGAGSGASCSSQTVCCSNNSFHGVIAVGCTPINLNA